MKKFFLSIPKIDNTASIGLLLFRISIGSFMLSHGIPKLLTFSQRLERFADPLGLGIPISLTGTVVSEVICAVMIILGSYTRLAAVPFSFTMLVAGLIVHADDPFGGKEKALLFAVSGILLLFTGPGKYSLDQKLLK